MSALPDPEQEKMIDLMMLVVGGAFWLSIAIKFGLALIK